MSAQLLNPGRALLFRIVHRDNLPWILQHGLHARTGEKFNANYRNIGNPDLIEKRSRRGVPIPPGGVLSDYVPFYFTPYSIMMYNIRTGYGGIPKSPNEDIVILVSSLRRVAEMGLPFVFTNQHAYPLAAEYFADLANLDQVDWPLLQSRDFRHDPDDPGKKERYQAEALVWKCVPLDALLGICCYNDAALGWLQSELAQLGLAIPVAVRNGWYFQ